MVYEVWIFSRSADYKSNGGVVSVTPCPPTYGTADAEAYANQMRDTYAHEGIDVTTLVRREGCY